MNQQHMKDNTEQKMYIPCAEWLTSKASVLRIEKFKAQREYILMPSVLPVSLSTDLV